jgi:hypothetical protein
VGSAHGDHVEGSDGLRRGSRGGIWWAPPMWDHAGDRVGSAEVGSRRGSSELHPRRSTRGAPNPPALTAGDGRVSSPGAQNGHPLRDVQDTGPYPPLLARFSREFVNAELAA